MLVACAPGSRSQSAVSRVRVRGLSAPPCRWLPLPGAWTRRPPLLFIFQYLCAVSLFPAFYLNTQHWRCSFVEIQMYLSASQADSVDVQDGLVPIQLDSGDRLKKGVPYSSAILTPLWTVLLSRTMSNIFVFLSLPSVIFCYNLSR